jgi:hypothetical protein
MDSTLITLGAATAVTAMCGAIRAIAALRTVRLVYASLDHTAPQDLRQALEAWQPVLAQVCARGVSAPISPGGPG